MNYNINHSKIRTLITFSLLGVAAYLITDIIHEVLGHAGFALLLKSNIKLLTSVYFISTPQNWIISLAGPISNLIFGILSYFLLRKKHNYSILIRLLLILIMSYNLFWFSGTIIESIWNVNGDWTYFITNQLGLKTSGKIILFILGIFSYKFSINICRIQLDEFRKKFLNFPLKRFIQLSYISALAAAIIAGLFFEKNQIGALIGGAMEMLASIPIMILVIKENVKPVKNDFHFSLKFFIFFVIISFAIFCLTLGKGLG